MMNRCCVITALMLCGGVAYAATYDIYPTDSLQTAVSSLHPDDTLYLHAGSYHETVSSCPSGTPGHPITIASYPGEQAVLDGTVPITGTWTVHCGAIYRLTLAPGDPDIWQLFVDGDSMINARWPNVPFHAGDMLATIQEFFDENAHTGKIKATTSVSGHVVDDNDGQFDLKDLNFSLTSGTISFVYKNLGIADITQHTAGSKDIYYSDPDTGKPLDGYWYYVEGVLELLDAPGEWFYDKTPKTIYAYMPDGQSPAAHAIRGKNMQYAFTDSGVTDVTLDGLRFYGCGLYFKSPSKRITFQNCDFRYSGYNKRMIVPASKIETDTNVCRSLCVEDRTGSSSDPSSNVVRNCTFKFSDTDAVDFGNSKNCGDLIDNVLCHGIAWTRGIGDPTSVGDKITISYSRTIRIGDASTMRRVTVEHSGSMCAVNPGDSCLLEYIHYYDIGAVGTLDGTTAEIGRGCDNTTARYCWSRNHKRLAFRFDGASTSDAITLNGTMHHMVALHCGTVRIKGDQHKLAHFTAMGLPGAPDPNDPDGNVGAPVFNLAHRFTDYGEENGLTTTWNIAADMYSNDINTDAGYCNWTALPGTKHTCFDWQQDVASQLVDAGNLDFRPKAGSALIDAGTVAPNLTGPYVGPAPDIGAYEYGNANYWIPGYQSPEASVPIPKDGASVSRDCVDLMWLIGYQGVSSDVYYGSAYGAVLNATHASPEFKGNQTNNIYTPTIFAAGGAYCWRIDTVLPGGSVVRGSVWRVSQETALTCDVIADSWTKSNGQSNNYGGDDRLVIEGSAGAEKRGFVKFTVSGVNGEVTAAQLTLKSESVDAHVSIYSVSPSWEELMITWANQPPNGAFLDTKAVAPNTEADFEVTSAVVGNGAVAFAITSDYDGASGWQRLVSREGGYISKLTIWTGAAPASCVRAWIAY